MGNAQSRLDGADHKQFEKIREVLSYETPGAEHARRNIPQWDGRIKLINKKGIFPTGLLTTLLKHLTNEGISYNIFDERIKPKGSQSFKLTLPAHITPRDYQKLADDLAKDIARGVYVVGTGGGKTLIAAMIIAQKQVPILFVTPDTGLRQQAYDDFVLWFGEDQVGDSLESGKPIVVANIQALARAEPEEFERFHMLMIDEFHHSAAKTYKALNLVCLNAYYRYGFTGTFLRSDGADMEMHGVLSKIIFTKTTSELIKEGHLVRPYITFTRFETKPEWGRNCNYKLAYDHIISDSKFHELVAARAQLRINERKQTLVLVRRKEHGRALAELLPDAIFLSGDDPMDYREEVKKLFTQKKVPAIIATSIFGEGTDIPSIDALVNARCEKTEIQTRQGIGRVLRKFEGKDKAEVDDFLIIGQKHLEAHSVERLMSYKSESEFVIQVRRNTMS